jgi:hypothetical protein
MKINAWHTEETISENVNFAFNNSYICLSQSTKVKLSLVGVSVK